MPESRDRSPLAAWLGEDIRLDGGTLRFAGSLRIDGQVIDGHFAGPSLVVGEGARISGRVDVERLEVYGKLDGHARVGESAIIARGGTFSGEMSLRSPSLTVHEGGEFRGRVRMEDVANAS